MSIHRQIQTAARTYLVAENGPSSFRALIVGVVQDALTGEPVFNPVTVEAPPGMIARVVDNRLVCLSGESARVFPQLHASGTLIDLTFRAEGYRDTAHGLAIPANAVFPINLPALILLDPLPTRVRGRVMTDTITPVPIANALVTVVDPTLPLPDHVLGLRTPPRAAHAVDTPVRARALTPTGSIKLLLAPAAAATLTLVLEQRAGLAVNTVLQIGAGNAVEFAVIVSLNPVPADPNLPGEVYLRFPLFRSFPAGSPVTAVTVGAVGASSALKRAPVPGEALLVLNSELVASAIEIADAAPARVEYHAVGALTDADGFYTLDGVGRVVTAQVRAESGGLNATQAVRLDYRRGVTRADFLL